MRGDFRDWGGLAVAVFGVSLALQTASAPAEWEDLAVNAVNRLPPRTYTVPLADEKAALTDALDPESPYRMSLNGDWKFRWTGDPALREKGFWRPDYDDSRWFMIDVPSCVEMRGFGSPGYVNYLYPHKFEWPHIRDRQTGEANYNPVSSYRRTFTIPESWKDRRVILRFDGVCSAYYVWVNGQKVGYAEDSKLPSEFDITKYLRDQGLGIGDQENVLAVEVYRWCDGSYLEDQDMFRFSGIFRDVTLWSMPKDGIWDFTVRTTPVGGYERWKVEVEGQGLERASVALYDAEKKKVCELHSTPTPNLYTSAALAARAWSAEKPYLYTLVLKKGADIRMKRVGFKEQRIEGHTFLVNGKPVKLKGVNRHETSPENGRTVSLGEMVRDITLMKRYNINTVRTSHYPDHRLWYDLCDRYGLYVVAEANVEGHEPGYHEQGLGRFPEWQPAIVERNARHVQFYRNHPCIVFWSLGNETGHGEAFRAAGREVRRLDPTRFVHWERGNPDADIDSSMYPEVDFVRARGRAGDGLGELPRNVWEEQNAGDSPQSKNKPYFICEYAHAMGNAVGNLSEYWEAIYAYESTAGGCIWDWVDQAIWKRTDRLDSETGRVERYLAYGGDFDENPNDGPFNCNGLIDARRNVSAKLVEVGHVYRNLIVHPAADGFELENRFAFTDASAFEGELEILEDGRVVTRRSFDVPSVPPLSRAPLKLDLPFGGGGRERLLNVSFKLRTATPWAEKGWPIATDQLVLEAWPFADAPRQHKARVTEGADSVDVSAGTTEARFSRATGTLASLKMNGLEVLADAVEGRVSGPRLTCARAFTDNDVWMREAFYASGLTQLRYHAQPIEVLPDGVRTTVEVTGSKSAGYVHTMQWSFAADGCVTVLNGVVPHGRFPAHVPRLGLSWKLSPRLENMRWYGRGPWENACDRKSGSALGIWAGTVADQFVDYVRPQDNGGKCDVRWVAFTDAEGRGVRFSGSEPLFVQALHFGWEDLEFARHRNGQTRQRTPLRPRPEVCLTLDVRQVGLGGGSCGPGPLEDYLFDPNEKLEWTVLLETVERSGNDSEQEGK